MSVSKGFWVGLVFLLAACSSTTPAITSEARRATLAPTPATPDPVKMVKEGENLFLRWCSSCHGIGGVGNVGPAFTDWLVLPVEFVQQRVRQGPNVMYEFTTQDVPDSDVAKIVAYLQAKVIGTTRGEFSPAELQQGEQLYAADCAECHGEQGAGKPNIAPLVNRYPPFSITQLVTRAQLPLPTAPHTTLSAEELRFVAAYIQSWAQ